MRQANFRLPEQLLEDLRDVARDPKHGSQSEIVRKGIAEKVRRLQAKKRDVVAAG